jgi:hypothetical protein
VISKSGERKLKRKREAKIEGNEEIEGEAVESASLLLATKICTNQTKVGIGESVRRKFT